MAREDGYSAGDKFVRVIGLVERLTTTQNAGLAAQLPVIPGDVGLPDAAAHVAA